MFVIKSITSVHTAVEGPYENLILPVWLRWKLRN